MLYKRKGFPEEGEVVLCTVKKILQTTVFVTLDEYENKEGIIHISEIAPGRIRTIRDYIAEEKKIVCKVLRANQERGSIDVSLRRVTKSDLINKNQGLKKEQMSEKVLEVFAQGIKKPITELYKDLGAKIIAEYGSLHACFEEVLLSGEEVLTAVGVEKNNAKKLAELIQTRMKPPQVKITQSVHLKCKTPNGIEVIKNAILKSIKSIKEKEGSIEVIYCGAPRYDVAIKANDYKTAEKMLEQVTGIMIESIKKDGGEGSLVKK